jgi:hypothetical protein
MSLKLVSELFQMALSLALVSIFAKSPILLAKNPWMPLLGE